MISSVIRRLLVIGLVILVFTIWMASVAPAFADENSSPKIECREDTEVIESQLQ